MIKKLLGGAVKGVIREFTGNKEAGKGRDEGKIENTVTNAKNKARGTQWSADEQKGYEMFKRMNPEPTPAKFDSLPKTERQMYIDNAKDLGHNKSGTGPAQSMASADGFSPSAELNSKSKESSNLGNLLGGLASAFG